MAIENIRSIGFFGHASSGKTTIADALLFCAGANSRFGKVTEKTSAFDFDPEEIERLCSLNLSIASFNYKDFLINLIDTPGYSDFIGEAISGTEAVDCAVIVIDAVGGIEVGTERLLQVVEQKKLPLIFFINKIKKENADFFKIFSELRDITKRSTVPLTIPLGDALQTKGVIDVLNNKAFGPKGKEENIPDSANQQTSQFREKIIEAAADTDDALMSKYVDGQTIEFADCLRPIKQGLTRGSVALCLAGDAIELIGIHAFLQTIIDFVPAPNQLPEIEVAGKKVTRAENEPFLGYVFKTAVEPHLGEMNFIKVLSGAIKGGDVVKNTSRESDEKVNQIFTVKGKERKEVEQLSCGMIGGLVKLRDTHTTDTLCSPQRKVVLPKISFPAPSISMAIVPKAKGDEEKISQGLARLHDEDPTFTFVYDPTIKQLIVSGVGELHLDTILQRLKRKYGVSVELTKPRIKYRETFTKKTEAQGKYKKQTGGHGQYGDCWLRVEPLERGTGFEFKNGIVGGKIPSRYVPSVEKGVREALEQGVLAGYQITDIRVTVFEGSYHPVDSSDIAFKIAASMAIKSNAEKSTVVLLEPINEVTVFIPESYMGDVIGDLNSRRGKIMGMEGEGKVQKIKALVPEAEMYKYSTSLRSMTQGRGYFDMTFHHYEEVPKEITKKIVAEAKREEGS